MFLYKYFTIYSSQSLNLADKTKHFKCCTTKQVLHSFMKKFMIVFARWGTKFEITKFEITKFEIDVDKALNYFLTFSRG